MGVGIAVGLGVGMVVGAGAGVLVPLQEKAKRAVNRKQPTSNIFDSCMDFPRCGLQLYQTSLTTIAFPWCAKLHYLPPPHKTVSHPPNVSYVPPHP